MTFFNLITSSQALFPNIITLGVRASTHEFGGDTIQAIQMSSGHLRLNTSITKLLIFSPNPVPCGSLCLFGEWKLHPSNCSDQNLAITFDSPLSLMLHFNPSSSPVISTFKMCLDSNSFFFDHYSAPSHHCFLTEL